MQELEDPYFSLTQKHQVEEMQAAGRVVEFPSAQKRVRWVISQSHMAQLMCEDHNLSSLKAVNIPSRELTYPPDVWHIWVDDFPFPFRWDMLVFLEGSHN